MDDYFYKMMCKASKIVEIINDKLKLEDGQIVAVPQDSITPIIVGNYYKQSYNPAYDNMEYRIVDGKIFEAHYHKETKNA